MTQVTFYQLEDDDITTAATQLVLKHYRARQQSVLVCEDKVTAEHWDEHLWQQPTDAFIPHNLRGEGPPNGAPVMIVWQPANESAYVMFNFTTQALTPTHKTKLIVEFVPTDEAGKQAARERYKHYQRAGCQLQFQPMPKESHNG
ncbi:DNA polymerase III subunit chi [Alteromonas oceanisediminis]|uniref:DNA polymerase III subunit chi n=1 Tax=Alteromonas oceanisediminis TaxID=2836180 RepID=UPI001BD91D22|nr:DNA polymerase III subunit chi [Alteromonas oceanisediminis]MBT0585420.1 DNA polymerase III subunit chi [Alteromonas oceanisediminis]